MTNSFKISVASFCCALVLLTTFSSCDTYKRQNKETKGGLIGVGAGAAAGTVLGHAFGNTALGAIIGGALGGTAGVLIGHKMDKQASELQQTLPNATVKRVGEGIDVKFDSGILFDVNKDNIKPAAITNLNNLAISLQKNPQTNLQVDGYTDNTGSAEYNLSLSDRRANAVKAYLMSQGVDASRLTSVGYGMTHPTANNSTEAGRAQNRRVEIGIMANQQMKSEAKNAASNGSGQ